MEYIPYQKCPKCDAKGTVHIAVLNTTGGIGQICDVCNGAKIIPMYKNTKQTTSDTCIKCHNGEMIWDGLTLTSNPVQYSYKCTGCSSVEYRYTHK